MRTARPGRRVPCSSLLRLFELDERAQKILRVHERDAIAVNIVLRLASAEDLRAVRRKRTRGALDAIDVETEVMDAAGRIALEKLRNRRARARRLHQLEAGIAKIDPGNAHALLHVRLGRARLQAIDRLQSLDRRL